MEQLPTYAVLQTPTGRGAVAVIGVSGPRAATAVDAHFLAANSKPLAAQPFNAIRFGHWNSPTGEEIVVCHRTESVNSAFRIPNSEFVEVHCHGGQAAAAAILADLCAAGCEVLEWPAWLRQLAADPLAAEARIALAAAPTERTAAILLDQYHGALSRALRAVLSALERGDVNAAARDVDALLTRATLGRHLTDPWRVVVAGPPNVGKSSLINALVGYGRSIVFDQPGTTRDVVTVRTAIDGWPVELADTAGFWATDDPLEAAGVELATQWLEQADLVVLVRDATQPQEAGPQPPRPGRRVLHVRNKIDLLPSAPPTPPAIDTSAVTRAGIDALIAAMARSLAPEPPEPGAAIPFALPQQAALQGASDAIAAGDPPTAKKHIQALLAGGGIC